MYVKKFTILVKKSSEILNDEIFKQIKAGMYNNLGGMFDELKLREEHICESYVYLGELSKFPSFLIDDTTIAVDVCFPIVLTGDGDSIPESIVGEPFYGFQVISSTELSKIYYCI